MSIRDILDVAEWRKVSCPLRYSEPPSVQPIAIRYIDYAVVVVAIVATVKAVNIICANRMFSKIFVTLN